MAHRHRETWFHKKGSDFNPPNIIRYADDFVVLHEDKSVVQRCREISSEWLEGIGLELKPEKGRCTHCGLTFREGDVIEVDQIIPKSIGGKDEWKNLQLLHRHCHDVKTASDGSTKSVVTNGKHVE